MSTRLSLTGDSHDIDVSRTAAELLSLKYGRFEHPVDWPGMWHPGNRVLIWSSDRRRFTGQVLDVSHATRRVLIELDS